MAITKVKGDIGQAMVMADVMKRGHKVLLPVGEDWRFDLVALRNGKLERVQCKYSGSGSDFVGVHCQSTNNWKTIQYTPNDIDWLAVYHPNSERCYYVPSAMLGGGRSTITLRLIAPRNNQKDRILWAKDFLEF